MDFTGLDRLGSQNVAAMIYMFFRRFWKHEVSKHGLVWCQNLNLPKFLCVVYKHITWCLMCSYQSIRHNCEKVPTWDERTFWGAISNEQTIVESRGTKQPWHLPLYNINYIPMIPGWTLQFTNRKIPVYSCYHTTIWGWFPAIGLHHSSNGKQWCQYNDSLKS